jgi:hypothetical protein
MRYEIREDGRIYEALAIDALPWRMVSSKPGPVRPYPRS